MSIPNLNNYCDNDNKFSYYILIRLIGWGWRASLVVFLESATFLGNFIVILLTLLCIFTLIRKCRPQRAQKAGQRPWFLVGTNQTEWKSIVWVNEVATWLSLPSKNLSINRIYVYDKGRVVFPQHILLLFLPQTALLILNLINSYKFCHEKGRVVLKRQFNSHFSNKKTAIFIFICL